RDLPVEEAAQLRGAADSVALRLRYHDDGVHSKRVPGSPLARAVFEAVEQARVEALGARRMAGVAANLGAMLEEQYRRQGFERITERTESTMAEAVRLLTREALTKERPPLANAAPPRRGRGLSRLQHRLGRGDRSRQAVRRGRAIAAAPSARPAALAPAERHRAARQPAAAPADGEANPRLGIRSRRGP